MTTWAKPSTNSTTFSGESHTYDVTIPAGTLIGMLGGHSYATAVTVTYNGYNNPFTKGSTTSTVWA